MPPDQEDIAVTGGSAQDTPGVDLDRVRQAVLSRIQDTPAGVDPRLDRFRQQEVRRSLEEVGVAVDPDDSDEGYSPWTFMRPDVWRRLRGAAARGAVEGWNSLVRTVKQVSRWSRKIAETFGVEEDPYFEYRLRTRGTIGRELTQEEKEAALRYVEEREEIESQRFNKRHYPGLTVTPLQKDVMFGENPGGLYGVIESLTEFGTEFILTGGLMTASTKVPVVGARIARGLQRLDQAKLTAGAVQSGLTAAIYSDPYEERVSTFLAEAPADLGNPVLNWIYSPIRKGAEALKPDTLEMEDYARAQVKNVLEDFLLGLPLATAGILFGAAVKRAKYLRAIGEIDDEVQEQLIKRAEELYAEDLAKAAKEAEASPVKVVETPEGEAEVVIVPPKVEPEGGAPKLPPDDPEVPPKSPKEDPEVPPKTPEDSTGGREGVITPPGEIPREVPEDLRGPVVGTKVHAHAAAGAIDRYRRIYDLGHNPIDEETLGKIRRDFKEIYKEGEAVDPRSVEEILERYGLNERYLASPEDNIAILKAIADVRPEVTDLRKKPTTREEVIARAKELFPDVKAEDVLDNVTQLGIALDQAPAVMTAAKALIVLQHRELSKLVKALNMQPGNKALEDMAIDTMGNIYRLYTAFAGTNASVARTLAVPNQMPSSRLVNEFGPKFKEGLSPEQRAITGEFKPDPEPKPRSTPEAQARGDVDDALDSGGLSRTEGGLDLGTRRLTRQEALDLAHMAVLGGEENIEGMLKLMSVTAAAKRAPEAQKLSLARRIVRIRTEMILSGMKTQAINIVSNMYRLAAEPAGLLWYGASRFDGEAWDRGIDLITGYLLSSKEAIRMAARSFSLGRPILDSTTVADEAAYGMLPLKDALTSPISAAKILGRIPGRLLGTTDEFFSNIAYRAETRADILADIRESIRRGEVDPMSKDALQALVERRLGAAYDDFGRGIYKPSIDKARDYTFKTDLEGTPKKFQDFVKSNPIGEFFFPFVRASTNIFDHIHQLTPGLNVFNKRMQEALAKGGIDAKRAVARAELGAALYAFGAYLAVTGQVTGNGPSDPSVRAAWIKAGYRPYTITIGDKQYDYRRGDPFLSSLGIMADLWMASGEISDADRTSLASTMIAVFAANATNKSYMSNVDTIMQALSSGEGTYLDRLIRSSAASFVPSLVNDFASVDPYEREVRSVWDAIKSRIPGMSETLEPRMNFLGEPMLSAPGFWNEAANPFTAYPATHVDFVGSELVKLGRSFPTLPTSMAGGAIDLTDREYFGKDQGGKSPYLRWHELMAKPADDMPSLRESLEKLIKSDAWPNLTDSTAYQEGGQKYTLVANIIETYRKVAWAKLLQEYPTLKQAWADEQSVKAAGTLGEDHAKRKVKELQDLGRLLHRRR